MTFPAVPSPLAIQAQAGTRYFLPVMENGYEQLG